MFSVPASRQPDGRSLGCPFSQLGFSIANDRVQLNSPCARGSTYHRRYSHARTPSGASFSPGLAMNHVAIVLTLALALVSGQLNFEGNPLTENTDYTAEESQVSQRSARNELAPQKLFKVIEVERRREKSKSGRSDETTTMKSNVRQVPLSAQRVTASTVSPVTRPAGYSSVHYQGSNVANPAELALNDFLNSKTPEQSRASLDHYLQSRRVPASRAIVNNNDVQQPQKLLQVPEQVQHPVPARVQMVSPQIHQQAPMPVQLNQQLNNKLLHQQTPQIYSTVNQQLLQSNERIYGQQNLEVAPGMPGAPMVLAPQQILPRMPYAPIAPTGIQSRNDYIYSPAWYSHMRRVQGKPYPYAQSRLGPTLYKAPFPGVVKKGPVEIIYTRPPGFHGHGPIRSPPVGYQDATAFFPEVEYGSGPPATKDVYYSQLYAQSYDPHYYNYIAKTGKIKPHLYGKLGKYHEEEESGGSGIWAELFSGFKKHGLKNMMTPTFLLGMTLPVITLMLTALVQKRSISRSDSREFSREDEIQELYERVQRALECYEKKWGQGEKVNLDDC